MLVEGRDANALLLCHHGTVPKYTAGHAPNKSRNGKVKYFER